MLRIRSLLETFFTKFISEIAYLDLFSALTNLTIPYNKSMVFNKLTLPIIIKLIS